MDRLMIDLTKIYYQRQEHYMIDDAGYSQHIKITALRELTDEGNLDKEIANDKLIELRELTEDTDVNYKLS